jgi:hypothetical protein
MTLCEVNDGAKNHSTVLVSAQRGTTGPTRRGVMVGLAVMRMNFFVAQTPLGFNRWPMAAPFYQG